MVRKIVLSRHDKDLIWAFLQNLGKLDIASWESREIALRIILDKDYD